MNTIIEFKNVNKEYVSGDHILKAMNNVNFTIDEGEFVVILGPSGAGKSTLLNLLGGLDSVTSGEIIVNGSHIESFNDNQLTQFRAKNVGFIFQFYNLIPNLTALENVELMKDIVDVDIDGKAILDSVGLSHHADQFPAQLSGGEQQRVSIARALASNVNLIFADEPTGNLDTATEKEIISIFKELAHDFGKTIIVVTHSDSVSSMSDQRVLLKDGKLTKL